MPLPAPLVAQLEPIRTRLHAGPNTVLPIVGSGISRGLLSWTKLLEQLIAQVKSDDERGALAGELAKEQYLDVAGALVRELHRGRVSAAIEQAYKRPTAPRPGAYDLLAKLPVTHFATTNYDPWLKDAIATRLGQAPRVYTPEDPGAFEDLSPASPPLVLMLHGDADRPATCVLSDADYRRLAHFPAYRKALAALVGTRSLLFVGHSLSDPDLRLVLDEWQEILGTDGSPRHWALGVGLSSRVEHRLLDRGVMPVEYGMAGDYSLLQPVLEHLAQPPGGAGGTAAPAGGTAPAAPASPASGTAPAARNAGPATSALAASGPAAAPPAPNAESAPAPREEPLLVTQSSPSTRGEIADLEAQVEAALHSAPELVVELIGRKYGTPGADPVARRVAAGLVAAEAQRVAVDLADLHESMASERDRRAARELLFRVLPLAIDWHRMRIEARAELARASGTGVRRALPLPLLTGTIAEVVLAGVDGRRCVFLPPENAEPLGAACVPLPPSVYAPILDEEAAVDDVVAALTLEREGVDRYWRDARRSYEHDKRRLRAAVNNRLADRARKENRAGYLPHYLLLIDDALLPKLAGPSSKDLDALCEDTVAAFGKHLPALRIVRLQADKDQFDVENPIVHPIWRVCARP